MTIGTYRASAPLLALLLAACAGTAPQKATAPAESGPALETVRPALNTLEDSLILDVLLGYREMAQGGSDREIMRRARSAQNQLDYMLRHGGVKDRGAEARVLETPAGEKATLAELTAQMSRALLKQPLGPNEAERAREIQRHRADLSFLAEDADWVLTLSAALESPLPDEDKRGLRRLHESYSNRAPHGLIAPQVTALLQSVRDERLRKELKKLANRSWERDRRRKEAAGGPAAPIDPEPAPAAAGAAASKPAPLTDFDAAPDSAGNDTLTTPERFCEERRADAAQSFAAARAAQGTAREGLLRQSLATLDECLVRYPDAKGAEKARGNRDRVQKELEAK